MNSYTPPSPELTARRELEAQHREQAAAAVHAKHAADMEARRAERQAEALRLVEVKAARRAQLIVEAEQAAIQAKIDARADREEARRAERERQAAKKAGERKAEKAPRTVSSREPDAWEHGQAKTYQYGCRCDLCKVASSAVRTERRAARMADPTSWKHGKVATYNNYGCRCDLCKEARRVYRMERYVPRTGRKPEAKHGTLARYTSKFHLCRCDECRAAKTEYSRNYYLKQKEAAANG